MLLIAVFHHCTFLTWENVWRVNEIATRVHQFQLCLLVCIHGSLIAWLYSEHRTAILMQRPNESNEVCVYAQSFQSCMTFCNQWTRACQAPLSMGFSRQQFWSGLPCPPLGASSWPRNWTHVSGISCIAGRVFTHWTTWEAPCVYLNCYKCWYPIIGPTATPRYWDTKKHTASLLLAAETSQKLWPHCFYLV